MGPITSPYDYPFPQIKDSQSLSKLPPQSGSKMLSIGRVVGFHCFLVHYGWRNRIAITVSHSFACGRAMKSCNCSINSWKYSSHSHQPKGLLCHTHTRRRPRLAEYSLSLSLSRPLPLSLFIYSLGSLKPMNHEPL